MNKSFLWIFILTVLYNQCWKIDYIHLNNMNYTELFAGLLNSNVSDSLSPFLLSKFTSYFKKYLMHFLFIVSLLFYATFFNWTISLALNTIYTVMPLLRCLQIFSMEIEEHYAFCYDMDRSLEVKLLSSTIYCRTDDGHAHAYL